MDNIEDKVKIQVPKYIIDTLHVDMYDFNLSKNKLCNYIFSVFHHIVKDDISYGKKQDSTTLQFTLNQANLDLLISDFVNHKVANKSEYFRQIFYAYCNQARYKRERALYAKEINLIEQAIKNKKQLVIRYRGQSALRIIEPYVILSSENETRNYVYGYCYKNKDYCTYRVATIEPLSINKNESHNYYNDDLVQGVIRNFDPFLSYGFIVKARLTVLGKEIYDRNITHRPHILKQDGEIYEFECSELRARIYFPQLLGEVEILEPLTLREWFKNGALEMVRIYT